MSRSRGADDDSGDLEAGGSNSVPRWIANDSILNPLYKNAAWWQGAPQTLASLTCLVPFGVVPSSFTTSYASLSMASFIKRLEKQLEPRLSRIHGPKWKETSATWLTYKAYLKKKGPRGDVWRANAKSAACGSTTLPGVIMRLCSDKFKPTKLMYNHMQALAEICDPRNDLAKRNAFARGFDKFTGAMGSMGWHKGVHKDPGEVRRAGGGSQQVVKYGGSKGKGPKPPPRAKVRR